MNCSRSDIEFYLDRTFRVGVVRNSGETSFADKNGNSLTIRNICFSFTILKEN